MDPTITTIISIIVFILNVVISIGNLEYKLYNFSFCGIHLLLNTMHALYQIQIFVTS